MSVPALRLLPRLVVIEGGRQRQAELEELRMELQTSRDDRLRFTDAVRDLVRAAMRGPAATYLEKLDRRNEREALRARSIDLCPDHIRNPGHGPAA